MRSDDERLRDILEAIAAIKRHATDDFERYQRDEPLRAQIARIVEQRSA